MEKIREIYLDNSATTKCCEEAINAMTEVMRKDYGNPSSAHYKGLEAEHLLQDARKRLAATLKVTDKEIYFTSGATESDNWALVGAAIAHRRRGMHLITTAIEHPAVLMPMEYLKKQGFRVTILPVDEKGQIRLEDLEEALCPDTILVSMMYVNNEIGSILPIAQAGELIHRKNPQTLFHVDAVQAYGKLPIYPKKLGIDLLSVSAHKIHGPKGIGFLYIRDKVRIAPLMLGGGQQKGMRSGTDNVPGAVGFAQAASLCCKEQPQKFLSYLQLKDRLMKGLQQIGDEISQEGEFPAIVLNSQWGEDSAPHIVSAAFPGIRSEVMLHALEEQGICVSAGSACSTNKKLPVSPVLQALGLAPQIQESTLRFSFGRETSEEEIDLCLAAIRRLLPQLRRYIRH